MSIVGAPISELHYNMATQRHGNAVADLAFGAHQLHAEGLFVAEDQTPPMHSAGYAMVRHHTILSGLVVESLPLPYKSADTPALPHAAAHDLLQAFRTDPGISVTARGNTLRQLAETATTPLAATAMAVAVNMRSQRLRIEMIGSCIALIETHKNSVHCIHDSAHYRHALHIAAQKRRRATQYASDYGYAAKRSDIDERPIESAASTHELYNKADGRGLGVLDGSQHSKTYIRTISIPLRAIRAIAFGTSGLLKHSITANDRQRRSTMLGLRRLGMASLFTHATANRYQDFGEQPLSAGYAGLYIAIE
jgi:hypothetical protein